MDKFIDISYFNEKSNLQRMHEAYYFIIVLEGKVHFEVDFNDYTCAGKNIIFLSPYQILDWKDYHVKDLQILRFHGDYYCIEDHKKEVACNGILFNNIYQKPFVSVSDELYDEIIQIFTRLKQIEDFGESHILSVAKSYLQLVLALCSSEKQQEEKAVADHSKIDSPFDQFKTLLDQEIDKTKTVSYFANLYGLSVDVFGKKIKKIYGKPASKLIQERLSLEAKKLLHLTYKSIKEIAAELAFEDEFYFSRYFKREVGVSPKTFREQVGISIVAKKSM